MIKLLIGLALGLVARPAAYAFTRWYWRREETLPPQEVIQPKRPEYATVAEYTKLMKNAGIGVPAKGGYVVSGQSDWKLMNEGRTGLPLVPEVWPAYDR